MRIVGNLDVEVTWARMDAAMRRARGEKAPSPDDPRFALPEPVMRKISAAATLLRVFAEGDDDVLWTPRPIDPSRMPALEFWPPMPRLESGPLPAEADLWWGEPTGVAARVNHRAFAWEVNDRIGGRLPGSALVRSVAELERAAAELARSAASMRHTDAWVAKAPLSAAGRQRVRGTGGVVAPEATAQAQRLLDLQGLLVFEPWVNRIVDFGLCARVFQYHNTSSRRLHGLEVDGAGRFVGIDVPASHLDTQLALNLCMAAERAEEGLRAAGYTGEFGIDSYIFDWPGSRDLRCISEINGRMTFGSVAHEYIEVARSALRIPDEVPVTLRFGRGVPPDGTIALLLPGTDDDTSAWLEVSSRHAG